MNDWVEMFRALGQALIDVIKAEVAELAEELKTSGKHLGIALGLFAAAGMVMFWTVATVIYTLIQVIALWLPLWGAALVVTGICFLLAGGLAGLGILRLHRTQNPVETVKSRLDDHGDWWQNRLLASPEEPLAARQRKELV